MEIFDSHTHINSHEFDNDIPDVIERAKALDVTKMLVIGYDDDSRKKLQEIIQEDDRNKDPEQEPVTIGIISPFRGQVELIKKHFHNCILIHY